MHYTKVLFLTNNEQFLDLFEWIAEDREVECRLLQKKIDLNELKDYDPDLIISYGYRYIIKEDVINSYEGKIINLHISYLPWNKGADPNIWSYLDDTPKGVTIHLIDKGIDTGDILFQKSVSIDEERETLSSSYDKLQEEIKKLFKENWKRIKQLEYEAKKQEGEGSIHYLKDWEKFSILIDEKRWNTPIKELKQNYKEHLRNNENF